MHRRTRQSLKLQKNVDSNSSDSDSDTSPGHHSSALDVINSFLQPVRTVVHVNYTPTPRQVSNVVGSFIQRSKIVDQASPSQFDSALDVINSYLRKDNFGKKGTPAVLSPKKECCDSSTSESGSEFVGNKRRRRRVTESSTSDSDANTNVPKKRRIVNTETAATVNGEPICKIGSQTNACTTVCVAEESPRTGRGRTSTANNPDQSKRNHTVPSSQQEVNQQSASVSTRRKTLRSHKGSLKDINSNVKSKQKGTEVLKVSFTREVVSRKMRTQKVVEKQTIITDYQIPKEKYDRAWNILNATESRYDETPVDYNAPTPWYDFRKFCNGRRYWEQMYATEKMGAFSPVSLTRVVFELENCLKKENWPRMAELIYFGCGLIKTDHNRRAIGGAFFTYALLLLILDSSPDSTSTLEGKRSEIHKFLDALGNEPEEIEEFLNELHLGINDNDTNNDLLTNRSEKLDI